MAISLDLHLPFSLSVFLCLILIAPVILFSLFFYFSHFANYIIYGMRRYEMNWHSLSLSLLPFPTLFISSNADGNFLTSNFLSNNP